MFRWRRRSRSFPRSRGASGCGLVRVGRRPRLMATAKRWRSSNTIRRPSGNRSSSAPEASWSRAGPLRSRWPPSASPTSARQRSSGIASQGGLWHRRSSGRAASRRPSAVPSGHRASRTPFEVARACSSIPISRPPRSCTCWRRCRDFGHDARRARFFLARSTRSSSGGSRAAACMPPMSPTPAGHCSSTSTSSTGVTNSAGCLACRGQCCRRCVHRAVRLGRPTPPGWERRSRLRAVPATRRQRHLVRAA